MYSTLDRSIVREEIPSLVQIHTVPVLRQKGIQIFLHNALTLIGLHRIDLFAQGFTAFLHIQIQRLALPIQVLCLCPHLQNLFTGYVPRFTLGFSGHLNRPEAAVASNVTQESCLGVGGTHNDTLPWVTFHRSAIGRTIDIIRAADEGFYNFNICFLKSRQFAQLQKPISLQFLRSCLILHIRQTQTVGIILFSHSGKDSGLAAALRTYKHHHGIELCTRLVNSRYRRHKGFSGRSLHIPGVVRTKEINIEIFEPCHTIPLRQSIQPFTQGIEMPVLDHLRKCHIMVSAGEGFIADVNQCLHLCCICIPPEFVVTGSCPRHGSRNLHSAHQLIECDICKVRVIV